MKRELKQFKNKREKLKNKNKLHAQFASGLNHRDTIIVEGVIFVFIEWIIIANGLEIVSGNLIQSLTCIF